jgi:hypothetical protein
MPATKKSYTKGKKHSLSKKTHSSKRHHNAKKNVGKLSLKGRRKSGGGGGDKGKKGFFGHSQKNTITGNPGNIYVPHKKTSIISTNLNYPTYQPDVLLKPKVPAIINSGNKFSPEAFEQKKAQQQKLFKKIEEAKTLYPNKIIPENAKQSISKLMTYLSTISQ